MKKLLFVALILCEASFAQTNVARMLSGVNAQTGTSYTFVASDVTKIVTFNNANPVGATLPVGSTTGFGAGSVFTVVDLGVGTVTITCSGCTINGAASIQVVQNSSASLYGDGTNYISASGGGGGGGSSIAGSTALGTQVGGNGAGGFASTSKPIIDPRDSGIDCSGATDSSTALNALFTAINQKEVDFPKDCQIRADHQIVIQGQSAFVLKGMGDRPGVGGFGGPSIYGCNGSAGALLYINRSGYGRIEGIGIYPKGPAGVCASSSFTQSVQIDSTGNPGVTTHDIILDHVALTSNAQGTAIANYIGVSITDGGKQNGEMIKVTNSWIHCQNSTGSVGIFNNNGTSDNDLAEYNHISSCKYGIESGGNMRIVGNLLSSNGANSVFGAFGASIYTPSCSSGQVDIFYNEADSSGPFIDNGHTGASSCTNGFNVIGNAIGVSDIASGEYIIDVGGGAGPWNVQGNNFLVTQNTSQYIIGSQAQPALKGPLGHLYELGNNLQSPTLSNTLGWEDITRPFQEGESRSQDTVGTTVPKGPQWGTDISTTNHLYLTPLIGNNAANQSPYVGMRSWTGAAADDWRWQTISSASQSALTFNHASGPASTLWFNWDGQLNGLKIAALATPGAPTGVTPTGTPGGTTYTYAIVAYGQSGNTAGSATLSTSTGNPSLDGSNYNLIQFVPVQTIGANKWCIWRTVGGATQGNIGCVNSVATNSNALSNDVYFLKDTGLTGDSAALPTLNSTGKINTVASSTGAAGLNLPHGTAPATPINGDLWTTTAGLWAQINGATVGPFSTGGGGGGLSGQTALGFPIAATATTSISSTTPGTNQGTYILGRFNTVQGSATSPIELQAGDCSTVNPISGATPTYTIAYTDIIGCNVEHDIAASHSTVVTIPNPATLNNPAPIFVYTNNSLFTDTLTPSTYQISMGSAAAGASLSVPSNVSCKVQLDPVNGSTYKADCHLISTSTPTVTFSGSSSVAVSAGAGVNSAANGTVLVADGSGNAIPRPAISTVGLGGVWTNGNPLGIPVANGSNSTLVNATMYVQQVNLVTEQVIGNATFDMVTCAACAEVINACMYNSAGSTLLWSGVSGTINGTGAFSATGTQSTLTRGVYYFAYSASGGGVAVIQGYTAGGSTTDNILNKNGVREGTAANGISGGACPASLGVLTGTTTGPAKGTFALEP